ncbi:MAG: hypothetical protein M3680_29055 [Myxococcota bacterium]|nr:hypothetical protein [Myxococcota bacterium]
MASRRTNTKSKANVPAKKPTVKVVKKAKTATIDMATRHPRGKLTAKHESKAALAKSLAAVIARSDEDTDQLEARLKTASNAQLLRLQKVSETVKQKYGSRSKLITAITDGAKKGKDKDYLAKLESYSLPQLLDLAVSGERRARS